MAVTPAMTIAHWATGRNPRYDRHRYADHPSSATTATGSSQPRRLPEAYSRQNMTMPPPDSAASAGASDAT